MDLDVSVKHWHLPGRERLQARSQCPCEDGVGDERLCPQAATLVLRSTLNPNALPHSNPYTG